MALIRQAQSDLLTRDAIVLDLGDLARQGEQMKAGARARAAEIVQGAERERERILAGAAEEGRAAGIAEGRAEGIRLGREEGQRAALEEHGARLRAIEGAWDAALVRFEAEREGMLQSARTDVLELAILAAEKIVKRALRLDPSLVADQVEAALRAVARPTGARIVIHPEDEAIVRDALPGIAQRVEIARNAALELDASLERGSCVVRTPGMGEVDASIAAQIDRITEALLPGREPPAAVVPAPRIDAAPGDPAGEAS